MLQHGYKLKIIDFNQPLTAKKARIWLQLGVNRWEGRYDRLIQAEAICPISRGYVMIIQVAITNVKKSLKSKFIGHSQA